MITRRRRVGSDSEPKESTGQYSTTQASYTQSKEIPNPAPVLEPPLLEMTCRDRTNEFMSAVKSFHNRQGNGLVPAQQSRKVHNLQQWSDFMRSTKLIGRDLSQTYAKLEKLTILAKRKSLFDDRPREIQELTYIIKQDINNLNKEIAELQEMARSRNHQNGKHMQSHSNSVVVSLQSKLATMSNEFKQVLEVRTENLKQQRSRRDQFSQGVVATGLPPSALSGYHQGSVLLADETSSKEVAINMDMAIQSKQQMQMQLVDEQDSYIQSRAETMQNIESTIVELGGIFQQLAHMVKEQEEMVQRIDANVEDVELNVEAAHGEILKYFQSVTSNRWLMIKIFGILIFFFIIFIVFLA